MLKLEDPHPLPDLRRIEHYALLATERIDIYSILKALLRHKEVEWMVCCC